MKNSPEPIQLLQKIVKKDRDAFSRFYDLFSGLVYAVALRILRNTQDADELVQDVFWKVWESAESFDIERGAPQAWLVTIARTRAIDRLRSSRKRRESSVPLEDIPEIESFGTHQGRQASEMLWARAALNELSEIQREALELAYFEGFTQSEIAARLDVPLGTVKTRIRDGLNKLRERFSQQVQTVTE